jgi:hypothetical protein
MHVHNDVEEVRIVFKPKIPLSLTAKVIAAKDLIKADANGTDAYVKVQLAGKGKKKSEEFKSRTIANTSDPPFDFDVNFGKAKKGQAVEFSVWQDFKELGDVQIGFASKPLKELQRDNSEPIDIPLVKPRRFPKKLGEYVNWGSLSVVLELHAFE